MNRIRTHLVSPAMIVACASLIVALGGVSYAAAVLPKNSVGTAQLQKNAVSSAKLKRNAVTEAKVKDGSLLAADFKAGQLAAGPQGPKGDTGPKGDPGPAAPASAVSSPSSLALPAQQATVVDLAAHNSQGNRQITLASPSRVVANASIEAYTNTATASEVGCFLYITDGNGPSSGLTEMEPDGAYSEMPATKWYSVALPLVGAEDKPAGTYNVQVKCEEDAGDVQFSHGSLVVWATPL